MTSIRPADLRARRQAILLVLVGTIAGALAIAALDHYRAPLETWLLSDPKQRADRLSLASWSLAAAVALPLTGLAAYLWSIGVKAIRGQEFPPPGVRVIRDTPIHTGGAAIRRGHMLKALALALSGAAAGLLWVMAQLAEMVSKHLG